MRYNIKLIDINYICCFLMSIWTIFPFFYRNINHVLIIICFGVWVVTALAVNIKITLYRPIIYIGFYILFILAYKLLNISEAHYIKYIQQMVFWLPLMFWDFYHKNGDENRNSKFIRAVIGMYCFSFIWNVFIIIRDPMANIMYNRVGGEKYLLTNIGETPFSYVGALVYLFSAFMRKNVLTTKEKRMYTILMIISAVLVLAMQRSITIILVLAGIVYELYKKNTYNKNVSYKIFWLFITLLLTVFVYTQYNNIITLISPLIPSDRIVDRLRELGMIAFRGDSSVVRDFSGTTRINHYMSSIETWKRSIHNLILGVGYPNMSLNESYYLVGGHSELFDTLARYGIVGTILVIVAFYSTFKEIYRETNRKYKYIIIVFGITTLVYGILSGFLETPSIGTTLFLFIPMGLQLLSVGETRI